MPSSRPRFGQRLTLLASLGAAAAFAYSGHSAAQPGQVHVVRASGAAGALTDSRGGAAIVSASHMLAGDSVSGYVRIAWSGGTPATVELSKSQLVDNPGFSGGPLSSVLWVSVDDSTVGRRVYEGPLDLMGNVPLGSFAAGSAHDFHFVVQLPRGAANNFQGASTSVRFDWLATGDGGAPPTGGGTPPPPVDTRPPVVRLTGKRAQRAKRLSLTAVCDEPCKISAKARLAGAKGVKAPRLRVRPRGATVATITAVFDKRSLKKIRRGSLTVTVRATDVAGNRSRAVKKKIRLKR